MADDNHIGGPAGCEPGRRERKKNATREALRLAALQLVAAHGLEHVTVEAIAAAADVSERTFFNYFATKEEAVASPDPEFTARIVELVACRRDVSPLDALHEASAEWAASLAGRRDEWELRIRTVRAHPGLYLRFLAGFARTEAALAEALAERCGTDVDTDVWPRLLAASACAAMRVAVSRWSAGAGPLDRLVDESFAQLRAGFAGAPAPSQATSS